MDILAEALLRWAPAFEGYEINFYTDNSMAMWATNKGYSANPTAMQLLKDMAKTAVKHNVRLVVNHLPGTDNDMADAISRLHNAGEVKRFRSLLNSFYGGHYHPMYLLPLHMSQLSYAFLLPQFMKIKS